MSTRLSTQRCVHDDAVKEEQRNSVCNLQVIKHTNNYKRQNVAQLLKVLTQRGVIRRVMSYKDASIDMKSVFTEEDFDIYQ